MVTAEAEEIESTSSSKEISNWFSELIKTIKSKNVDWIDFLEIDLK